MTYQDPVSGRTVGQSVPIVSATEADIKRFSETGNLCGECHYFLSIKEEAFAAQVAQVKLLTTLVDEYEWKLEHAFPGGLPVSGLCEAHGYITQVYAAAKDCAFTPSRGKVRRQASDNQLYQIIVDKNEAQKKQKARERGFRERFGL